MRGPVYTYDMHSARTILAILLSLTLFVQGVAASTMRSCHMNMPVVEKASPPASHQHHHDQSEMKNADMTEMSMRTSCAWCAAGCISLALPASEVTTPELFAGSGTVFSPLVVAPSSRLPDGWDRPPRT